MSADLMVDIETLSTRHDAAILTIGACSFDRYRQDKIHSSFEARISMEDNTKEGRHIDGSTVAWWFTQSREAQQDLLGETTNLRQALKRFRLWIDEQKPVMQTCWANDPDFDVVILKHACDQLGERWPFMFFLNRSCRTIFELAYPDIDEQKNMKSWIRGESTHHKAVDDAIAQAKMVQHCFKVLGCA